MKFRVVRSALSIIALFLLLTGCSDDSGLTSNAPENSSTLVPDIGPAITASPNPAPARGGSTTIAWNTGGGIGEVYLVGKGSDDRLFARGEKGSQEASWIAAGVTYEFRLYNADKSKVLGAVTVTRQP